MNKNLFFSILIFLPLVTLSQKRTLLIGGTAYVGNGEKIENSVICIEGEKIDFIANIRHVLIFLTLLLRNSRHIWNILGSTTDLRPSLLCNVSPRSLRKTSWKKQFERKKYCKRLPSHTGQEQACSRITQLVLVVVTMPKMAQYTGKWLFTAPKVKPFPRPYQTRKEEWLVQPVFCTVHTGSCLVKTLRGVLIMYEQYASAKTKEIWSQMCSAGLKRVSKRP